MAELKPKVKPKACISLNCLFAHMSAHLSRARSGRARLRHPGRRLRFAQFVLLQHLTGGHCLLAEAASKPAERGEGPVLRCHCTCLAHAHCLMPEAGPLSCQERRAGLQSASMVRLQMLSALPCARSGLSVSVAYIVCCTVHSSDITAGAAQQAPARGGVKLQGAASATSCAQGSASGCVLSCVAEVVDSCRSRRSRPRPRHRRRCRFSGTSRGKDSTQCLPP